MNPYDAWNYPSKPFRYTRTDRMELIARLHSLSPRPAPRARVLEIGCGTGGNLLPMAEAFPEAQFVGLDLAATQIAAGQELQKTAGLTNVELRAFDLCDIDKSFGEFDYIIAHGVYSWVPDPVKARLLDVIAERLAPLGVAYLSYNVKPGWYKKAAARDMMRYHTRAYDDARDKVAQGRAILDFVLHGARDNEVAWKSVVAEQAEIAKKMPEEVVYFDHLSDVNDACYFHELAAELPPRGLTYLSDASFASMMPNRIPAEAVKVLDQLGDDFIRREQYLDFLKNREFRTSLLVRTGAPISRRIAVKQLFDCNLASRATPVDAKVDVEGPDSVLFQVPNAVARVVPLHTRRALSRLASRWPAAVPFRDLAADAGSEVAQLVVELFQLYTFDILELWLYPDMFVVDPPERPRATPLARALAARGVKVSNLRHETETLEPAEQKLLTLLDGTNDVAALGRALPGEDVPALLRAVGKKALLAR